MSGTIEQACTQCERRMTSGELEPTMTAFVDMLARTRATLDSNRWRQTAQVVAKQPVHAVLMHDPYTADAYRKARGYAGDAETLDFVYRYREPPSATTALGRRLFSITTDAPIACAVRARSRYLADAITRQLTAKPDATVVSVAAGYMRELEWLDSTSPAARFFGFDHDQATIARLSRMHAGRVQAKRLGIRRILTHVDTLPAADLIYAAALFEYLDDRTASLLIQRLRTRLRRDGALIVTNLTARNVEIGYMEAVMDWWMVYRDVNALRRLLPDDDDSGVRTHALVDGRVACLEIAG
jgi:extracellular factor (EF) 3-hydroxypalmitic acid methyl ester biosynthesis protein